MIANSIAEIFGDDQSIHRSSTLIPKGTRAPPHTAPRLDTAPALRNITRLFSYPAVATLSRSLLLSFSAALLLAAPVLAQEVLDGIAATVNNDVVTFSQVRDLVGPKERQIRETLKGEALTAKIKEIRLAAVNELINRQLILQEFAKMKEKGAQIPSHVVDEHVETIVREQFGGDKAAFIRTLQAQGYTLERFRQLEEEKIIVQAMRSQQLKGTSIIPESRIREYYQQHASDYSSPEEVKLRMLVMHKPGGADDTKTLKTMQELREKIVGGAAFPDIAHMYSEQKQEESGDWGWINRKTLSEPLTKAAFALKPGEVSKILDLFGNYYILYCEAKKTATTKPFAQLRDEIEKTLIQDDRAKQQDEWIQKLRKKAAIQIY